MFEENTFQEARELARVAVRSLLPDSFWQHAEKLIDYAYDCCVSRQLTAEERVQFGLPAAEGED